jgi:L-lactate dehydrogenase complex protein LldG
MLLQMWASATEKKETPWLERVMFRTGGFVLRHSWLYRAAGWTASKLQRPFLREGALAAVPWPLSRWTKKRIFPAVASQSFQSRWKKLQWEGSPATGKPEIDHTKQDDAPSQMIQRTARSLHTGVAHAGGLRIAPAAPPQGTPAERFCVELEAVSGKAYRAKDLQEASRIVMDLLREKGIGQVASWDTPLLRILEGAVSAEHGEAGWLWGPSRAENFDALKTIEIGVTEADFGLAASGTLVLLAGLGRSRLISLLPAIHLALLPINRLVEGLDDLPEVFRGAILPNNGSHGIQAIDLITGPSRSSDIGMIPTLGAHGPKEVHVILLESERETTEAAPLEATEESRPENPPYWEETECRNDL